MNILVIGSGGREHCIAWKLKQSSRCGKLFIAPGNAGTASVGENLPIKQNDFEALAKASIEHNIQLLIVGPEEPLVKGIVDYFKNDEATAHIQVIGPSKQGAMLEGSKVFAKAFMKEHQIPTPPYREFSSDNYEEGVQYIKDHPLPVVLKADGLAAGKGVLICKSTIEALSEFELMLKNAKFGDAGKKVVVEQFLDGIEMSAFILTDGKNYVLLPEAKDYKKIGEADTGLNTGGMGAVSPVPFFNPQLKEKIIQQIIEPTIKGIQAKNLDYCGFIFFGLFVCDNQPYIIEYNCRMGDPETEVVFSRMKNDMVELLEAAVEKKLDQVKIETDERYAVAVVAASEGYPGDYEKGIEIRGIEEMNIEDSVVFHAGTRWAENRLETNGGRVLVATSLAESLEEAVEQSVYVLETIHFDGMQYRKDIGYEFRKPKSLK